MIEWNISNSSFFADNISSKVKEQLYAAATIKRYKILGCIGIVTFALSIIYTYWIVVDARVKKEDNFQNRKS